MAASMLYDEDQYLNQLTPVLLTYWNNLHDITNIKLLIKPQLEDVSRVVNICINSDVTVPLLPLAPFPSTRSHSPLGDSCITANKEALSLLLLVSVYNDKLKHVLMKCIAKEQDLNEVSFSSKVVNKLTELKKEVEEFSTVIKKVIEYYYVKSIGLQTSGLELPTLEHLKEHKKTVTKLQRRLKINELHSVFAEFECDFNISEEIILCAVLGLNRDIGDWLAGIESEKRQHRSDMCYIMKYIESREEHLFDTINSEESWPELCARFVSLGFTQERAVVISKYIPHGMTDVHFPSYWAKRYLGYAFLYHPLINDVPRYPFSSGVINTWFKKSFSGTNRGESDALFQVDMVNICSDLTLIEDFLIRESENDDFKLLFHGTTHEGAKSILEDNITLQTGEKRLDFSHGDGFYLSEEFKNAHNWSGLGKGDHLSVVVFKIPKDLLDVVKQNGLDLTSELGQWQELVRHCRTKYCKSVQLEKLLDGKTFIRGPVCLNPIEVAKKNVRAVGFDESEIQICLRDEDYALEFGSLKNICCAIFY